MYAPPVGTQDLAVIAVVKDQGTEIRIKTEAATPNAEGFTEQ